MTVENFIDTSHWKLLISDIRPRHTSTALAAHKVRGTQIGKHCLRQIQRGETKSIGPTLTTCKKLVHQQYITQV